MSEGVAELVSRFCLVLLKIFVVFDRLQGVKKDVVGEGTHFLIPWLQKAIIYDVRTKPRNISTTTGSKDLQMVSLTLRVLHRPNVTELPRIYQVYRKMKHLC